METKQDDAMIRLAGESAGALCMGAERFVNELRAVKKATAHRVEAAMAKVNGQAMRPEKLWGSNVGIGVFSSSPRSTSTINPSNASGPNERKTEKSSAGTDSSPVEGAQETGDGRFVYKGRFGRGSLIIEDRRKKKPKQ
jgi:hypothetical protein